MTVALLSRNLTEGLPPVTIWRWALGLLPILSLFVVVIRGRLSTSLNAVLTVILAMFVGTVAFGANVTVLGTAIGKGFWTSLWILYVIWPALLLYHLASQVGLKRMGEVFATVLPRSIENILIVAWVFPSFIQGVAGFGTPIAVAAPLLVSMGVPQVRAVALPLIGYHWSVTFGSMGSSFYMGAITARLVGEEYDLYVIDSIILLGANLLLSGVLVCLMFGGLAALRDGARMLIVVGLPMVVTMAAVASIEPALGSLAAGGAGLVAVGMLRRKYQMRGDRLTPGAPFATGASSAFSEALPEPAGPSPTAAATSTVASRTEDTVLHPRAVMAPYIYLLVLVLAVFLPPGSRAFVKENLLVAPSFPATSTSYGLVNEATSQYTPIALLGHPGTFLLLATLVSYITYRLAGLWSAGLGQPMLRGWLRQASGASVSVIALATVATVMVDTGMVRIVAVGVADVAGGAYPLVAPIVGLLGSFTTGSTTSSNALFSALQRDIGLLIDVRPSVLMAAQTTGGNIGNSLAPVIIVIGVTAVGIRDRVGEVLRIVMVPAAVLTGVVMTLTCVLVGVS